MSENYDTPGLPDLGEGRDRAETPRRVPPPFPFGGPQRIVGLSDLPAPVFTDPISAEQNARIFLLWQVTQLIGPERTPDTYVELVRYLDTGLRAYDDPPAAAAAGTDPDVVDAEKIRTAVETVLSRHKLPSVGTRLAAEIVECVFPGVSS